MFKTLLARFTRESEGGVFLFVGLSLVVLVGFVGIAIDIGQWMTERRQVQAAADAAAIAAALEGARGATASEIDNRAKVAATANGYTDGMAASGGPMEVTINNPPTLGPNAGDNAYYEAIVRTKLKALFSRVINPNSAGITARAVAVTRLMDSCVYALDPTASGAITFTGTSDVSMDCGFLANSTSSDAIRQAGGSCVAANSLGAVGGVTLSDPSCVSVPNAVDGQPAAEDPYAYLQPPLNIAPMSGPCSVGTWMPLQIVPDDQSRTFDPGCYMQGIRISANAGDVHFNAGLYVVDGTGLQIVGGNITGSDLTFYFPATASGSPTGGGTLVNIGADAAVDLSAGAPEYPGILFYQDPNGPYKQITLTGKEDMHLNGVLYFPKGDVNFAGSSTGGTDWTVLVSNTVSFSGGANFATAAPPSATPLTASTASLVE